MTAQQLKNSILQMAVQGKLVPQDPNDEPASVLLERIRAEKEQLIKEKKIKKEKNPSIIFRGADNLPYEKVGKNEPVCIADEVPFEIPDSWEWTRLGFVSSYAETKKKIKAQDAPPDLWQLDLEDIEKGGRILEHKTVGERKAVGDKTFFEAGNVLYSKLRPYLLKVLVAPADGICTPEIVPFSLYGKVLPEYIVAFLKSPYVDGVINAVTYGVKMPRVGTQTMTSLLLPLPPLNEQQRIVNKINEVMPVVAKYDATYSKVNELNETFPEALKRSILQWAVQGKLVAQDLSDEPAEALLERIRAEKQRLVKEGKIKKDKHESVIFRRDNSHYEKVGSEETCIDNELPFDIPDTWSWVRFADIAIFENGDRSNKYPVEADYVSDGIPFFGAKDMGDKYMEFSTVRFITQEKFAQLGNGKLQNGDLVCLLRGSVGKTRIFKESEKYSTGFICAQMMIIRCLDLNILDYLYALINSPYYCKAIESKITGTAVRQLPAREVANILIPLPPLNEQFRIIEKLSEILFELRTL